MENKDYIQVILDDKSKLMLIIIPSENEIKLQHGEELIADKFREIIQFREELKLFSKSNSENRFLIHVTRTVNNDKVSSLCYTSNNGNKYYYNKAQCETIIYLLNRTIHNNKLNIESFFVNTFNYWSESILYEGLN